MSNKDNFLKDNSIKDAIVRTPAGGSQWFTGLSSAELDVLSGIVDEVSTTADDAVTALVRAKMRIGKSLNAARKIFKGDKEFGQWRKEMLPNISATETTYCMKIQSTFASAPELIDKMGWSSMREMAYAPESLIKHLNDNPDQAPATKAEARKMAKEVDEKYAGIDSSPEGIAAMLEKNRQEAKNKSAGTKEGELVPREVEVPEREQPTLTRSTTEVSVGLNKYPRLTIQERWLYYLSLPIEERISRRAEYDEDPYVILGLSPDTEVGTVSLSILDLIKSQTNDRVIVEACDDIIDISMENFKAVEAGKFAARVKAEMDI